jgi:hypothetical protein
MQPVAFKVRQFERHQNDIGPGEERIDDLRGVRTGQVECDAALAGVDKNISPTFALKRRDKAHGITRRRFDLDDIGAQAGEKPTAVWNGRVLREFDDFDAIEHTGRRSHCFAISLLAVAA